MNAQRPTHTQQSATPSRSYLSFSSASYQSTSIDLGTSGWITVLAFVVLSIYLTINQYIVVGTFSWIPVPALALYCFIFYCILLFCWSCAIHLFRPPSIILSIRPFDLEVLFQGIEPTAERVPSSANNRIDKVRCAHHHLNYYRDRSSRPIAGTPHNSFIEGCLLLGSTSLGRVEN